jgi:hypothetical protein
MQSSATRLTHLGMLCALSLGRRRQRAAAGTAAAAPKQWDMRLHMLPPLLHVQAVRSNLGSQQLTLLLQDIESTLDDDAQASGI